MIAALAPLLEALRSNVGVSSPLECSAGTLTPDGRLDLSGKGLGPPEVRVVVEALGHNTIVRSLHLQRNRLGDEGMRLLAAELRRNNGLIELAIGTNGLSAAGLHALCDALQDHPSLLRLDLSRAGSGRPDEITDESVFFLATLLRQTRSLESLAFDAARLSEASIDRLIDALFENESLTHLNLQRRVTSEQRRRIRLLLDRNGRAPEPGLPSPVEASTPISPEDLATATRVLQTLSKEAGRFFQREFTLNPVRAEANRLVEAVRRESDARRQKKSTAASQSAKLQRRRHDEKVVASTGMRQMRVDTGPILLTTSLQPAPPVALLLKPRHCYICKAAYNEVHPYYDSLCPACAALNAAKRVQTKDLTGKTVLITGGRIKIGYEATLMLLRSGARVVMTTRFPVDAARRLAQEPDFAQWSDRLQIHGIDLRDVRAVERLAEQLANELGRLDILINNAAQTVHRPPDFYRHLLEAESKGPTLLPAETAKVVATGAYHQGRTAVPAAALSQIPLTPEDEAIDPGLFPLAIFDRHGQQRDLRETNSWTLKVGQIATNEVLETHYVNAIAPFVLINHLLPLMERTPGRKFIVNVSAMEGKFDYERKQETHPHTNMAKASLNMLTRTTAASLADRGIFMTSVDTGWVTNENPHAMTEAMRANLSFEPPLDEIDGAARILDPVFGAGEEPSHGVFLKDYKPATW